MESVARGLAAAPRTRGRWQGNTEDGRQETDPHGGGPNPGADLLPDLPTWTGLEEGVGKEGMAGGILDHLLLRRLRQPWRNYFRGNLSLLS